MLEVRDLRVTFRRGNHPVYAVQGVSWSISRGETIAIVGESGSGKTTVALAIMGTLPRHALVDGAIRFEGDDLLTMAPSRRRALNGDRIGMINQDALAALDPMWSVGHHLMEVIRTHRRGISKPDARTLAASLLDRVGIPSARQRLDSYPHEFSGGMRQRVVIALAIALGPALVVADEPTTALDVTVQAQILDLLRDLQRDTDLSLVLITHDMGVVAETADRVFVMYGGAVVESGPVEDVFVDQAHPYTSGLLASTPRMGTRDDLLAIPGMPPDPADLPAGCAFHPRCSLAVPECHDVQPALVVLGDRACACHRPFEIGKVGDAG